MYLVFGDIISFDGTCDHLISKVGEVVVVLLLFVVGLGKFYCI